MSNDELKKRILSRRARFIAAALTSAGLGVAPACGGDTTPQVCLTPTQSDGGLDADADATPQACLTPIQPDAGVDATTDANADADAAPQPCLAPMQDSGGD